MMKPPKEMMPLLRHLVRKGVPQFLHGLADREIEPMNDGGMGSHRFASVKSNRKFGNAVAECHFLDADEVKVLATLNIDEEGDLFELDVWKTEQKTFLSVREDVESFLISWDSALA